MKQLKLLLLIVFLLNFIYSLGYVEAVELEYYGIEVSIREDFSIHNSVTLISQFPISYLDYQLDFTIYNLTVNTSSGYANCESLDKILGSIISCNFFGMGNRTIIKMDFDSRSGVKRIGYGKYKFEVVYGLPLATKRTFVIVKLPPKGILSEAIANESYLPKDGDIMTDGKHIMIYWERENLTTSEVLKFSVLYDLPGIGGELWNLSIMALTIGIVVVMTSLTLYVRKGFKEKKVAIPLLTENEKVIVDILKKHGNEVWQNTLVRESDFSKAKVSRLLKNLKDREVVSIEPVGRTNKITLKLKGVK